MGIDLVVVQFLAPILIADIAVSLGANGHIAQLELLSLIHI